MGKELVCPFDNTRLTRAADHYNETYFYYKKCGEEYSRYEVNDLIGVKEERLKSKKLRLKEIREEEKSLVKFLSLIK